MVARYHGMMDGLDRARALFGLRPSVRSYTESPLLGDAFLQSTPTLEGDIDQLPDRVHLVGACVWEPPGDT